MLLRAQSDFEVELSSSILVGDKDSDIEAARAAGVGTKILFRPESPMLDVQASDYYVSDSLNDIHERFLSMSRTRMTTSSCFVFRPWVRKGGHLFGFGRRARKPA